MLFVFIILSPTLHGSSNHPRTQRTDTRPTRLRVGSVPVRTLRGHTDVRTVETMDYGRRLWRRSGEDRGIRRAGRDGKRER
jgi:hypothetical protein